MPSSSQQKEILICFLFIWTVNILSYACLVGWISFPLYIYTLFLFHITDKRNKHVIKKEDSRQYNPFMENVSRPRNNLVSNERARYINSAKKNVRFS